MDAIRTTNLSKRYAEHEALRDVCLRVCAGRRFGFLGPNGAGKTTAIRILLGLLRATSGQALVLGQAAWRRGPQLRNQVGYLPGDVRFHNHLTGRETLTFFADVRGVDVRPRFADWQRISISILTVGYGPTRGA